MSTDKEENSDNQPNENREQASSVKHPNKINNTNQIKQHTKCNKNKTHWFWRRKTSIILQLVFSAALVGVYAFQVYYMRQQWNTMNEGLSATKTNVKAAIDAAKAANGATEIAKQNIIIANRAYLGMVSMIIEHPMIPNEKFPVKVTFKNSGHTPAYDVSVQGYFSYETEPFHNFPSEKTSGNPISIGLVLPNEPALVTFWDKMTVEHIKEVNNGTLTVYLFGYLYYRDVFDKHHISRFCGMYSPKVLTGFYRCPQNNDELPEQ